MRKLYFILLFIPLNLFSQQSFNFTATNGDLVWERIYETEISKEEIREILKVHPALNPIAETFSGQSNTIKINCESTQAMFMDGEFSFFASIDFKEGRYRVQVTNIKITPANTISLYGVTSSDAPQAYSGWMLKKDNTFRKNNLAQNSLQCVDLYFLTTFDFQKQLKDW